MTYFAPVEVVPAWKMRLIKILGKRFFTETPDGFVEYYVWRRKTYITDVCRRVM